MRKFSGPIFSAALLALLLWAYTRHNNFPFYYHTDELGKVEQVVSGEHNYRHPLLMINATDLVVASQIFGKPCLDASDLPQPHRTTCTRVFSSRLPYYVVIVLGF